MLGLMMALLAVAGCARPHPAGATVVVAVPFEAQAVSAGRIFVGTVRAVESRPNPARPQYFETLVTFAVEEVVAGDLGASVTLRFSGGTVGDLEQSIAGMPVFVVGERYVVLAEPEQDPPLVSPVVGFNQGLYRVVQSADGSDQARVRDRTGRPLATAAVPAAARALGSGEPALEAFVTAIRAARAR